MFILYYVPTQEQEFDRDARQKATASLTIKVSRAPVREAG